MIFGGGSGGAIGTGIVYSLHDNFSATADRIGNKWNKLDGITAKATANIQKSMNRIKVGIAAMAVGAVLLAPVLMGVGKSMEFNATMSEVFAKGNIEAVETQRMLAKESLRLGEATKFSAIQAAEGQAFLAMAGFRSNEIMAAMPGVLNLAAAGNLDLAKSADIASNILTGMGLKAKDMGRVADVLALGATSANVSVEMLGDTFAYAASTAKNLGWTLEQVTAMSGLLGNIGIQGSSAGTAIANFNRFLTRLDNKKLKPLGLTMDDIADSAGNMKSAPAVLASILDSVKGMGNISSGKILGQLFGPRGQKTISAFESAMGSALDFSGFVEKLDNSSGAAERISKRMLDNLKGDLVILGSVWETTLIKIGNAVEPFIRPLVRGFSKIIQMFGKLANSAIGIWVIRLTTVVGALALVIGAVIVVTNLWTFAAAKAAIAAATMGHTAIAATFATKGLSKGLLHVGKAALQAGKSFIVAMIPMWPLILAGAALVGIIVLIKNSFKAFDDVMDGSASKASGFLGFMQKLGGILKAVGHIWGTANKEGFTMTSQLHDALANLGILDTAIAIGTWIVRIKLFFKGVGAGIREAWNNVIKPITTAIGTAFEWLMSLFDKLGFSMDKNTSAASRWEESGKIVGIVIMSVLVPAFVALAISVISATWPLVLIIGAIFGIVWAIKNWGKITEWFGKQWSQFTALIGDKWNAIIDYFKTTSLKDIFIDIGQTIMKFLFFPLVEILKLVAKIPGGVGNFASKALEGIGHLTGEEFGDEEGVGVGDLSGSSKKNITTELALVNAQSKAAQINIPSPTILDQSITTEVIRDINIDMDGSEIRHEIDAGTEEDLNRQ